jgi:hypothetical protein
MKKYAKTNDIETFEYYKGKAWMNEAFALPSNYPLIQKQKRYK